MATKGSGGYGPSKKPKPRKVAPAPDRVAPPKRQPISRPVHDVQTPKVVKRVEKFKKTKTYKVALRAGEDSGRKYKLRKRAQRIRAEMDAENRREKKTVIQRAGTGVPEPIVRGLTKSGGVAMDILEETTRPLHAVAGSARAELRKRQGKVTDTDPVSSFVKGARNKERYTYSDVLKQAGVKNKVVRAGVGFVADVAADPTTYVTLGTASVARQTALKVGQKAEKKALAKGLTAEQSKKMGQRAAEQAAKTAPDTKKVTVGFGRRKVVTPVTSPQIKVRKGSRTDDFASAASPAYRKPGTPEQSHKAVRRAQAERRAAVATEERKLTALARSVKKKLKPAEYRQIIDAIEAGSLKALPDHLRDPAVRIRSEFRHMDRLDRQAGIRAGTRKNYVPHVRRQDVGNGTIKEINSGRPARGGSSAKHRRIDKRMAELRKSHPDLFTDDLPTILAKRGPETVRGVADVGLMRTLVQQGRKLTPETQIDTATEAIYHVPAKSSVPRKLERDGKIQTREIEVALDPAAARKTVRQNHAILAKLGSSAKEQAQAKAIKRETRELEDALRRSNGRYVILPKNLADDTIKSAQRRELGPLHKRYRRLHGKVKTVLTMPMPSYHLRNLYGDTWNASLAQNVKELGSSVKASGTTLRVRRQMRKLEGSLEPGATQKLFAPPRPLATPKGETWFHGTPADFKGAPTAKGMPADFGVYMTKNRKYAEDYADEGGQGGGRVIPISVNAKNVIDLRKGDSQQSYAAIVERIATAVERSSLQSAGGYRREPLLRMLAADAARLRRGEYRTDDFIEFQRFVNEVAQSLPRGTLRKAFTDEGYDAVRLIDYNNDTLVVFDESAMSVASRKPAPAKRIGPTVKVGERHVPAASLVAEMEKHGVVGTGFSRELREMSGEVETGNPLGVGKSLRNVGEGRENLIRAATYIGARRQGLSAAEAAERVRTHHFDYMDLTKSEEGIRDFLPFYTFARKNTPLQAKTLVTRPGKTSRYQKFVEEGAKASGIPVEDLEHHLKEYERLGAPIPLFGVRNGGMPVMILPGLPITDLNRLTLNPQEQVRQIVSMVTVLKAGLEVSVGEQGFSFFFRDEIDQGSKVPAPDWIGSLPLPKSIREELGLDNLYDKAHKRRVWKWKPKWDYILKQLPESNFLLQITTSSKNRRGQGTKEKLISLTGVRPQPIDKVSADLDNLYRRRTSIENRLKALSKAGVNREAIDDKTVPPESRSLVKEYERLRKKVKTVNGDIYRLQKRKLDRGDAVTLPKAGAPPKKKTGGNPLDAINVGGNPLDKVGGSENPLDAF